LQAASAALMANRPERLFEEGIDMGKVVALAMLVVTLAVSRSANASEFSKPWSDPKNALVLDP
jgi:hypothetical protein